MFKKKHIKILYYIFSFLLIGYLGFYLFFLTAIDQYRMRTVVRTQILNSLKPADYQYLVLLSGGMIPDIKKLEPYDFYFQRVSEFLPFMPEAHGMRGFCAYHMGRIEEAVEAYREAIRFHPHFFWYYYNLGVILFHQGRYEEALEVLRQSLECSPLIVLETIRNSPMVYLQVFDKIDPVFMSAQYEKGRGASLILIAESLSRLGRHNDALGFIGSIIDQEEVGDRNYFFYKAGQAAYALGQYSLAADFFKEYLTVIKDPSVLALFAQALHQAGQVDLAEAILRQAHNVPTLNSPEDLRPYQIQLQPY